MRTRSALLPALASLALVACGSGTNEPFEIAQSGLARDTAPNASAAEVSQLSKDNAAFAVDMYKQALSSAGNGDVFFSPYSISSALAMTYAGARNSTADEMAAAMHFSLPDARLHTSFNAVDLALAQRGKGAKAADGKAFRLNVVNSTFGQKGYPFEKPFLDTLAVNYGAGVRLCDFKLQAEPSRKMINQWVSDKTESRINDLLPQGTVDSDTRMVLVNAIYFNGAWAHPFQETQTATGAFHKLDGGTASIPLMNQTESFGYVADDLAQAVELPYDGNEVSMVVVLPRGDFKAYEAGFDASRAQAIFAGLKDQEVRVTLPKFEIKGATVSLAPALQALGMKQAFTGAADFSGIVKPSVERVFIGDVLHQAFVKVDEKGTEAAAATAVLLKAGAAPVEVPSFVANRPFLFFVRDIPTGTVLFAGRVASPK
jgi:serpin B